MIVLALTGSIGMGKSTTAQMFRDLGIAVHDADATVHALYSGKAVPLVDRLFPGTAVDGRIDRTLLSKRVIGDPEAMQKLEAVIHPLVRKEEIEFLQNARRENRDLVVLDIPLLFETGGESRVDGVVVVTASAQEQERRVLSRPGMTLEKFRAILNRQVPDDVKRTNADFIIDTGHGLDSARRQVDALVESIRNGKWQPRGRQAS